MTLNEILQLIATGLGIASTIVGAILIIGKWVKSSIEKKLSEMSIKIDAIETKQNRDHEEKDAKNAQMIKEKGEMDVRFERMSSEVDHLKEDHARIKETEEFVADLRETVAGFGKDYVTRREFIEERRDIINMYKRGRS